MSVDANSAWIKTAAVIAAVPLLVYLLRRPPTAQAKAAVATSKPAPPAATPSPPGSPLIASGADSVTTSDYPTLSRFIMSQTHDQELTILLNALALACKATARACNKAGIADLFGLAGEVNSTGDDQKKLDVLSNDIFINALANCGACAVLVSEENEECIIVDQANAGRFCVAFDPLDGSSNIDCNVSTGTIFAVYEKKGAGPASAEDILRTGNDIVVAGYCMYGAATELVVTFKGKGVHGFTLDPSLGEFILTKADMKIPEGGGKKIYSCNEGNSSNWDEPIKKAVAAFKDPKKPYAARYVGSMVSDVHRTILYGGIYIYPADAKSKNGKLRVLYEGFPMAMIVEQAGGVASCGMFKGTIQRMLDIVPSDIHAKCPVILGAARDVNFVLDQYKA
jgi:fructose-1,6-bisphosphatase I